MEQTPDVDVFIPLDAFLPVYHHLVPLIPDVPVPDIDIDLLFGGRDSGKSRFVASVLVMYCLHAKYFRGVLVRKVFNTIKDSQWQTIKDVIEEWGMSELFTFITSPLEIRCINGNRFIARGFDVPEKIKSTFNISHAWVEEGNELSQNDFIVLMSTLRSNKGKTKVWVTFNPEADGHYEDFWLYKMFYAPYKGNIYKTFRHTWEIEIQKDEIVQLHYQSTHSTYLDNRYVSGVRKAFLLLLEGIDPYYYVAYTLGKWGNRKVGDAFCFAFDRKKHGKPCTAIYTLPLYLSFDFNVNPITCGVYQSFIQDNGRRMIRCPKTFKLENSDIYALCNEVLTYFPNYLYVITGDATGRNSSALVQDDLNYYTVIQQKLNLSDGQIKVPSVNPKVKENRVLINAAFKLADVEIDPVNAKDLIFDCENVAVNDMGEIDKGDRTNPRKRADHLDHWRYYVNIEHHDLLKQ